MLPPANVAAQQSVASAPFQHALGRGGLVALGGITRTIDASFARLDLGVPTPSRQFRGLRALLVTEVRYGEDVAADARDLALTPELQYDWRLPFGSSDAEVVVVIGTGIMWSRHWVRLPDEPYWPSSWESSTEYAVRLECAFQYRRRDGLVISVQPLSLAFPLNNPEPPDARWMDVESDKHFAVSVLAGYQFR